MEYNEFKQLNEQLERITLNEMVNWNQDKTGLPCIISFQTKGTDSTSYKHKTKRIDFQNNTSKNFQNSKCIPIDIETGNILLKKVKERIDGKIYKDVQDWIGLNKDVLLAIWDGKITPEEAEEHLKKLNDSLN